VKLNAKQAGLSLGILFGMTHFVGVFLITLTNGGIVEFAMRIHHIKTPLIYLPLDIGNLIIGTILATISGIAIGALFATIWNMLEEKK